MSENDMRGADGIEYAFLGLFIVAIGWINWVYFSSLEINGIICSILIDVLLVLLIFVIFFCSSSKKPDEVA